MVFFHRRLSRFISVVVWLGTTIACVDALTAQTLSVGPSFRVSITLSPAAKRDLLQRKEKLRLFGYFYGRPKPGVRSVEGEVSLGAIAEQRFDVDTVAAVPQTRFKPSGLKTMLPGSAELLLNVVTARLSSRDNLLSCDIYEGLPPFRDGLTVFLHCGLITEQPKTQTVTAFSDGSLQRIP